MGGVACALFSRLHEIDEREKCNSVSGGGVPLIPTICFLLFIPVSMDLMKTGGTPMWANIHCIVPCRSELHKIARRSFALSMEPQNIMGTM